MLRRLFIIASAVSLLLCVGTVSLWARSYWVGEMWSYSSGQVIGYWDDRQRWALGRSYQVLSETGRIDLIVDTDWPRRPQHFKHSLASTPMTLRGTATHNWRFAGFVVAAYSGIPPLSSYMPQPGDGFGSITLRRVWGIPDWFLAAILAALPFGLFLSRRGERRSRRGLCRSCGYDLRATPDRCPECGTSTSKDVKV